VPLFSGAASRQPRARLVGVTLPRLEQICRGKGLRELFVITLYGYQNKESAVSKQAVQGFYGYKVRCTITVIIYCGSLLSLALASLRPGILTSGIGQSPHIAECVRRCHVTRTRHSAPHTSDPSNFK
jgi:hypothetical protein